jgi:hypothetical protein
MGAPYFSSVNILLIFIARTVPSCPKMEILLSPPPEKVFFIEASPKHSKFYRGKTAKKFFL